MKKGLLMIPYAYISDFNTGVNVCKNKAFGIYMKNCCVTAISARYHCGENTDIAIVTNVEIPFEYRNIIERKGVKIIMCPFDCFCFGKEYKWSLAFYKLCALSKVSKKLDYDYYAYIDSDVYVQGGFDEIWAECETNILMYDINQGLNSPDYCRVLNEISDFDANIANFTYYGGEFFAANSANTQIFVAECEQIYNEMIRRNFVTTQGDEFISNIAVYRLKHKVKNAGSYVYRYWTGTYRLISTNYKVSSIVLLHCPAEKKSGIITIFNRYVRRGKVPSNKRAHSLLHLNYPSLLTIAKYIVKKILNKPL